MGVKGSQMKKVYEQLSREMSKEDVINLLGEPDSMKINTDGIETLGWSSKEFKGLLRGGFIERTIVVEFKGNRVVAFEGNNINASAW